MGGNALTKVKTRRYNADEYFALANEVISKIRCSFPNYHICETFKSKPSFGDMDILIIPFHDQNVDKTLIDIFNPTETYRNDKCLSLDYKEFQLDFITVKLSNWETCKTYYGTADLGNFMGVIAKNLFGIKYGHNGLTCDLKDEKLNQVIESMPVSKNPKAIFEALGFDHDRFLKGFDTVEDIFQYVVDSKYFNAWLFDYEQLNHINKTRNRKRESYQKFLYFVKDLPKVEVPKPTQKDALKFVKDNFGIDFTEYRATLLDRLDTSRKAKKLAVEIIRDRGYENKELGLKVVEHLYDIESCLAVAIREFKSIL